MGYQNIKATVNTNLNDDECLGSTDFDILMDKSIFPSNDQDFNNLKLLSKYISDLANNIEKYIKLPLKESLLLINLLELNENEENVNDLIVELKKYIKIIIENCKNILQYRFDLINKNINPSNLTGDVTNSLWDSKLFINVVAVITQICQQNKLNLTNEKALLCVTEVYNYFNNLSVDVDIKFVNWFMEKFVYGSNQHLI